MISNHILDEIFPLPELSELKEEKIQSLKEEGFVITNFKSGGVFNTILMIVLQIYIEFIKLFRTVLNQMYVTHANGIWLILKAQDYSKTRKPATKTEGLLTLSGAAGHEAIVIPKGTTFKTDKDINGVELRYYTTKDITFPKDTKETQVPVLSEKEGAVYNVSEGRIRNCIKHLEGVESITNDADWITKEGTDIEDIEAFRQRILNSWSDLATGTTAAKYKAAAEAVTGVLYAEVNQLHPRGQGTVDIIITSTAGAASEELISEVTKAAEAVKGEYDNLLIKSAETVYQNIEVKAVIPALASDEGIEDRIRYAINEYFRVSNERKLNELILLDIYCAIRDEVPTLKNIKIVNPKDDIYLNKGNVILLGDLKVTVEREG